MHPKLKAESNKHDAKFSLKIVFGQIFQKIQESLQKEFALKNLI